MWSLKRWLARLSFSLLILAGLCAWNAYNAVEQSGWSGKPIGLLALALVAAVIGMVGVRARSELMRDI